MLKLKFLFILLFIFLRGNSQEVPLGDYPIYKSILLKNHQKRIKPVVIINRTESDTLIKLYLTHSRPLDKEFNDSIWRLVFKVPFDSLAFKLYQTYEKYRPKILLVKNEFNWRRKVHIVSEEEVKKFFQEPGQSGFDRFYYSFPNVIGFYKFSEILYSVDRNFAIVYYQVSINAGERSGRIVILKNEDGIWKVKYEANIWGY